MSTTQKRKWKGRLVAVLCLVPTITYFITYLHHKAQGQALKIVSVGQELETRGDIQGALEKYRTAVMIDSRFPYGLALLGKAYHQLGKDDKAIESYKRALTFSPRHFWVHYLIGQLYRDQGRYQDAIAKFNELITMKDNWYQSNRILGYLEYQKVAYGELGHCYAKVGDTRRAVTAYQHYLTLNPSARDKSAVEEYIQEATGK